MHKIDKTFVKFTLYKNAPAHLFIDNAYYIITSHTCLKIRPFDSDSKKQILLDSIYLNFVKRNDWELISYFIGNNLYHLLLRASKDSQNLPKIIGDIHRFTAIKTNKMDNKIGRQVWYQYWDTIITSQKSLIARFNYIHYNPVKHGYVSHSKDYKFCSFKKYFEDDPISIEKLIKEYPYDRVEVYEP